MKKPLPFACLIALCGCLPVPALSQEVVHALTGTVSSINSATKTITVFQDNGNSGVFNDVPGAKSRYAFDKKLASETVNVGTFNDQGAYAIVFYYGMIDNPTVVAVKPLGKGPFASIEGTITSFSGRDHSISITDQSGAAKTFKLAPDSVAEGDTGAIEASKLQARKGDHVRIVSQDESGAPTVLFVKDM
jgi:hypothetical protein